jgi:hypothetical protein
MSLSESLLLAMIASFLVLAGAREVYMFCRWLNSLRRVQQNNDSQLR